MSSDRNTFYKLVTVIYDTREQKNEHIINALSQRGIMTEKRKLDFGDYTFMADGRDFSLSCVIERKANVDELYNNFMTDGGSRIQKELYASSLLSKDFTILIEGVGSWEELRAFRLSAKDMEGTKRQVSEIGVHVYNRLKAWSPENRYKFNVEFSAQKIYTVEKMLDIFYYYWHNYKDLTAARR